MGLTQLGVAHRTLIADGQLMAAPCTTAGENGAAVFCFHTGAKAMSLGPLAVVRLKRTFWHLVRS